VFAILGCGFTGIRVARRLLARGFAVLATSRHPERLALPGARLLCVDVEQPATLEELRRALPPGAHVLHSSPLLKGPGGFTDPTPALLACLPPDTRRVVYLSTTGVYGAMAVVDEHTPPAPRTPRELLRVEAETLVRQGPWSALVLRPAAIYGPGRGVHLAMRRGEFKLWGEGHNFVSRIHADDLAALAEAALLSDLTGAWPVADLLPARSVEVAAFCARLLNLPLPPSAPAEALSETRRADRRVDGRAVFEKLSVPLVYPTFREGITQALEEEARMPEADSSSN
jgi:nucleoside-diphosphate-sugar epimerase